jgi:beta-lactamase class A
MPIMRNACGLLLILNLCLMPNITSAATTGPSDPVEMRANDVAALFRAKPSGYDQLFHPTFLSAIPAAQLDAIFIDYANRLGPCRSVKITNRMGATAAEVEFHFDRNVVPGRISVDKGDKHLIDGMWVGAPTSAAKDLDSIAKELSGLPGTCAFRVERLGKDSPQVLVSLNPDQPLALGSAFKLYILAELIRQIDSGERHWADVVTLDPNAMSLPSGNLQKWPANSPITIHTLAALMISQSDNTATDQLLHVVGREKVEAILEPAGNQHASMNRPFLSTHEMFKLHANKALAEEWLKSDLDGRRKLLVTKVANATVNVSDIGPTPTHIDTIEWFASTADLCRLMEYLRLHTLKAPAADARGILSINPGLDIDKARYPFIGFKGGSEVGVLNLTYLVESKKGDWYALSATWNNPKAALTENDLFSRVTQAFRVLPQ